MIKYNTYYFFQYTFCVFLCCISVQLSAQLNLNVGYHGSYLDNNKLTNDILQNYNDNHPWLSKSFKDFQVMDGLIVGTRYKLESVAFLLQWTNKKKNNKSKGIDPVTDVETFRDLKFQYNSYSAGLEFFVKAFSFGGTMDYNHYVIKTERTGFDDKYNVLSEPIWSSHFFINFRVAKSSNMSIGIQPYFHMPWTNLNLLKLEQELNPEIGANANAADYDADLKNFGISLIFYNGEQ